LNEYNKDKARSSLSQVRGQEESRQQIARALQDARREARYAYVIKERERYESRGQEPRDEERIIAVCTDRAQIDKTKEMSRDLANNDRVARVSGDKTLGVRETGYGQQDSIEVTGCTYRTVPVIESERLRELSEKEKNERHIYHTIVYVNERPGSRLSDQEEQNRLRADQERQTNRYLQVSTRPLVMTAGLTQEEATAVAQKACEYYHEAPSVEDVGDRGASFSIDENVPSYDDLCQIQSQVHSEYLADREEEEEDWDLSEHTLGGNWDDED